MRLGVYCDDPRAAAFLPEWSRHAELVVVPVTAVFPPWLEGLRGITRKRQWEELLTDQHLDAIFVGGTHPDVLHSARQLAQAGKPLWVLPHPGQGLLFSYELNLAAEETQAPLKAVFPHRAAAAWQQSWRGLTEDAAAVPDYVELTRRMPVAAQGGPVLALTAVEAQLLTDLDLLAWQLGRRSRVTVMRTGSEGSQIRRQTVTLAGDGVPEILWSVEPADAVTTTAECRFHIGGQQRVFVETNGQWEPVPLTANGAPPIAFAEVVPWSTAVTAFELFDAVEHSLERRRTVELHREPVSERAIFKTRMAAWGCGVLIGTLFLMLAFLMIASVVPLNGTLLNIGRALVFTPLFVFLLAQVLLPLTRAAPRS